MKKIMKHILALTLIVALLSTVAIPAFAMVPVVEDNNAVTPRGSYSTGSVKVNGKTCSYSAGITASTTSGAYTSIILNGATVARRHNSLTVVFNTTDSGYETAVGGYKYTSCKGTSESYKVTYSRGMQYVTDFVSVQGTVYIYGDTTCTIELSR